MFFCWQTAVGFAKYSICLLAKEKFVNQRNKNNKGNIEEIHVRIIIQQCYILILQC